MSAPDTNVEKQAERHKHPLLGMGATVVFAFIILVAVIGYFLMGEGLSGDAENVNPVLAPATD